VVDIMAELTDPSIPAANLAGATATVTGTFHQRSAHEPTVLADQGGHWRITNDTAMPELDAFWYNANRHRPVIVGASEPTVLAVCVARQQFSPLAYTTDW
jgi:hypothetical protein